MPVLNFRRLHSSPPISVWPTHLHPRATVCRVRPHFAASAPAEPISAPSNLGRVALGRLDGALFVALPAGPSLQSADVLPGVSTLEKGFKEGAKYYEIAKLGRQAASRAGREPKGA